MTTNNQASSPQRLPVTAVIIAKNEERHIEACLRSVDWADEIVVVDSGSADATCEIARRYAQKVVYIPWQGFGPQKQTAVELASHDWVFNLDCDERVTPELAQEIQALLAASPSVPAYTVPRRTFLGTKAIRYSGWYPDRTVRLFDRTRAHFSASLVHEQVLVEGKVGACRHDLLHFSFAGVGDMLPKMNQYSELSARQMFEAGRTCNWFDLTCRPLFAFMKTYLLRRGILDGFEGLVIAFTTAALSFLKYAKLQELHKNSREAAC